MWENCDLTNKLSPDLYKMSLSQGDVEQKNPGTGSHHLLSPHIEVTSLTYRSDKVKAAGKWTVRYRGMEGFWT
jgi:hypothetical protein